MTMNEELGKKALERIDSYKGRDKEERERDDSNE